MTVYIQIKLYASLSRLLPEESDRYPIEPGSTIQDLIERLHVPIEQARLVFVNNVKTDISTPLSGGERVGIFPPVGGG